MDLNVNFCLFFIFMDTFCEIFFFKDSVDLIGKNRVFVFYFGYYSIFSYMYSGYLEKFVFNFGEYRISLFGNCLFVGIVFYF